MSPIESVKIVTFCIGLIWLSFLILMWCVWIKVPKAPPHPNKEKCRPRIRWRKRVSRLCANHVFVDRRQGSMAVLDEKGCEICKKEKN